MAPKKEPPKKESPALPSVLTAADVSSMKGHQIKAQLKARGLPTGGLRPYLAATLEKVLDEEARASFEAKARRLAAEAAILRRSSTQR